MPNEIDLVLLAIDRRHAEAIYRGEKAWEYRRQAPAADPPYYVLLYATEPAQRITGAAYVDDECHGPVADVIDATVDETPHTERELRGYFEGREEGTALHVAASKRLRPELTLQQVGVASAPQNFQYVDSGDVPTARLGELMELEEAARRSDSTEAGSP